jgi:hypothetical protein
MFSIYVFDLCFRVMFSIYLLFYNFDSYFDSCCFFHFFIFFHSNYSFSLSFLFFLHFFPSNFCQPSHCQAGTQCNLQNGGYRFTCNCATTSPLLTGITCNITDTPIPASSGFSCNCPYGWGGRYCQVLISFLILSFPPLPPSYCFFIGVSTLRPFAPSSHSFPHACTCFWFWAHSKRLLCICGSGGGYGVIGFVCVVKISDFFTWFFAVLLSFPIFAPDFCF